MRFAYNCVLFVSEIVSKFPEHFHLKSAALRLRMHSRTCFAARAPRDRAIAPTAESSGERERRVGFGDYLALSIV